MPRTSDDRVTHLQHQPAPAVLSAFYGAARLWYSLADTYGLVQKARTATLRLPIPTV
jgi:hypothetical protein